MKIQIIQHGVLESANILVLFCIAPFEFAFPTQSLHIESVPERLLGTNGTSGKGADGTGSGSEATANPGGAGKS